MTPRFLKTTALLGATALIGTFSSAAILGGAAAQPSQHSTVHAAKRHHHHSKRHRAPARGIPQHNGGDHDSDNRGGPSDGDGNV